MAPLQIVLFVGVSILSLCSGETKVTLTSIKRVTLDKASDFEFAWWSDPNDVDVIFQMKAQTKGYVAIGFSPDGGMNNSDIVMGWVDAAGKAHVKDMHGVGNTKPVEDPEQNYFLVSGEEKEGKTIIRFKRRWAHCDKVNDKSLKEENLQVIWAYNQEDPKLADDDGVFRPPYHFATRGAYKEKDAKIQIPQSINDSMCQ